MTDYVLDEGTQNNTDSQFADKVMAYAHFLKQPLELGFFVPCVDNEPFNCSKHGNSEQFEQAKDRVLFSGFEVQNTKDWIEFNGGIRVYIPTKDIGSMFSIVFKNNKKWPNIIEDLVSYDLELAK